MEEDTHFCAAPASAATGMPSSDFSLRKIAVPVFGPTFMFGLAEGAAFPMIALTARELGASVALAGFLVALMGLGSLLSNIPAALITSRIGERRAIMGASAVFAGALLLCILAHTLWLLAIGVLLMGTSVAVFMLARQVYLTEAVPLSLRARAMSTLGGSMRIGVFIGPFLAAATMPSFGLKAAYTIAILAAIGSGVLAYGAPDITPGRNARLAENPPPIKAIVRSHAKVFMTLGVGVMLVSVLRSSRQVIIPLWAESLGIDAATTSLIYGLVSGIDMLVFYPAGKLMDTRGRIWVAVPSTLLMGISIVLMPFTNSTLTLLLVSLVLGVGNGISSGLIMVLGADASPRAGRTEFLGVWRLLADVGACSGPLLLSTTTAMLSLSAGIGLIGLLGLLATGVFWRWVPRPPPAG